MQRNVTTMSNDICYLLQNPTLNKGIFMRKSSSKIKNKPISLENKTLLLPYKTISKTNDHSTGSNTAAAAATTFYCYHYYYHHHHHHHHQHYYYYLYDLYHK